MAARDAIQAIVDELEEMISEDITLDSRVHARIIGARGKGIRKIMDEFKVRWYWCHIIFFRTKYLTCFEWCLFYLRYVLLINVCTYSIYFVFSRLMFGSLRVELQIQI